MAKLDATKRSDLPDSAFAYVDSKGKRRLPINDAAHVRNALARFEQVVFESDAARERARKKLLAAAKKHGIVPVGFITGQLQTERERGVQQARRIELPTGVVTMMMTDIESSTALVHALGDGYREVIDGVRVVLRDCAEQAGGVIVETRADELFAAFRDAAPALDAAVAMQRALRARAWANGVVVRVRIGIHTGTPTVNDFNYIGLDVHRAARISAAAHGGQVVVSTAARDAAGRATAETIRYRSLGAHRLRGIPDSMTLLQVCAKGLPAKFPPLRKS